MYFGGGPAYDGTYQKGAIMPTPRILPAALVVACLLLTGCKDQREPVKPIVDLSNAVLSA
jgi:hypothetical protein